MPYIRVGKCVYKQNSDGSKGAQVGCSDTIAKARAHLKALYANVPDASKEVSATPSTTFVHGPTGILSMPGAGGLKKKKKKKVTNSMLSPKEFYAEYELSEKDFAYANSETWVIDGAVQALSYLLSTVRSELYQTEADDSKEIVQLMSQLVRFISDQMDEMAQALNATSNGADYYEMKESKGDAGHGGYLVSDSEGSHLPTKKNGKVDHGLMGAAWAALHGGYRGNTYEGSGKSTAISKLKKLYASEGLTPPSESKEVRSQFVTTKEADGHYRWTLITGSAFEDRDGEIISEKAFQDDCDAMELTGDYGELLWWHCDGALHAGEKEARPYLPLGKCDTSLVYNKLNIESGLYYSDAVGATFTEKAAQFGASKAFWHKPDEPGEDSSYSYISTKERSLLPRTKESNLLTRLFGQPKEKAMADNKARIAALKEKLGDEETETLLATAKAMSEKAEKFLASKEAKVKKTAADDTEDAADNSDDETAEGETKKGDKKAATKEVVAVLTAKELKDTLTLALKEQSEVLTKQYDASTEKQAKALLGVQEDIAELQSNYAALMGLQPKAGFKASEKGKTHELTAEEKAKADKVDAAGAGDNYLAQWIISGERPAAA